MYKEKTGEELRKEALALGVSLQATSGQRGISRDDIIQERVRDAKRSRRESSLWIIALVSSIASIISALAAWYAVTI